MKLSSRFRQAAFTLAEVMVAIGLFGITAAASVSALLKMNNNAVLSRLQTGASTVAQNRIDLMLSNSPFNPQKGKVPPELTSGITNTGTASAPTVAIYTDPKTGIVGVWGWMVSTVADTGATVGTASLYLYRCTVTVNYKFRGRDYTVTMSTLRASDI